LIPVPKIQPSSKKYLANGVTEENDDLSSKKQLLPGENYDHFLDCYERYPEELHSALMPDHYRHFKIQQQMDLVD